MKRLDELGVSPAPLQAILHREKPIAFVVSREIGDDVVETCQSQPSMCNADAELIAAAPDLYEALRLCMAMMCEYCRREAAHSSPGAVCDNGCAVMLAAKAALEKAGGAE